jgi:hypothetical protein
MGRDRIEAERTIQAWRGRTMGPQYLEPLRDRTPPRRPVDRGDDIPVNEADAQFEVALPTWRDLS